MSHQDQGENFDNKDIRGLNFREKDCTNNKFKHSKAGIKPVFHYGLITLFCLLSILISVATAIASLPVLASVTPFWIPSLINLLMLGIFFFFLAVRGFSGALLAEGAVTAISLIAISPLLIAKEQMISSGVFAGVYNVAVSCGGIVMFAFTITMLDILSNRSIKYAVTMMSSATAIISIPIVFPSNSELDYLVADILTAVILSIGLYIAIRSLRKDRRFKSIRSAAIAFCSSCGSTSFRGADLANADFSSAMLRNVDFRQANLTTTRLYNAKDIEYACLDENHSLQNSKVLQLAITLDVNQLNDKNFNYLDLEGINLEGASLQEASFIGANLKNASLRNANLSGANLKQAQLAGTDLTGASLTGTCIEDWGITKGTVLENVKCEFIYLECREEQSKSRRFSVKFRQKYPINRQFKDGEFAQIAYLAWEQYEQNKTPTRSFQQIFYGKVENLIAVEHNAGEIDMSQKKGNVSITGLQGNVNGIAVAGENQTLTGVAIGAISGSVTNTINQLPTSPNPDNPGIKELLAQLQAAIEAESELPDEDKAEALEQVKTLAEAGQKPEDNALQKAAKTSMKILKGTVASLPDAAQLAEACAKLLPAIATLLAFI